MSEVLNAAVSFPAVIFTVTSVFFLGFWVVTTALGAGLDSLGDIDFDVDTEVDVDVDVDAEVESDGSSGGLLRGVLEFLGITGMPVLLGVNLFSIFAWATAMIAQLLIGTDDSLTGVLIAIAIFAAAVFVGRALAMRVGKQFDRAFVPSPAPRRRDFVGSLCTVTTQRVTPDFGQAEVRDGEGGSLIVQIRCDKPNDFTTGDQVLIFDVDDELGAFQVAPRPELGP